MRNRTILAAAFALLGPTAATAQPAVPPEPAALATQYIDATAGLTLTDAIRRALERDPTIRAARTEMTAAQAMVLQARLRPNPTLSVMQQQIPNGTDQQTKVEFQWPLDLFRKDGRVAVASQELDATQQSIAERERQLAADVRMKYGEVLIALRDLSLSDELVAATRRQVTLIGSRVQQGNAPALEANMLTVETRRLEAERLLQAAKVESAVLELKRSLGAAPSETLRVRETLDAVVSTEIRDVDIATAAERPDIKEAEARVRVADARIDRARRDGRTDMSLVGGYMRMDASFPQLAAGANGELEPIHGIFNYLTAGAMVSLPWRNRNQGEIAAARAARDGAAETLAAVRLTAQTEIAAANIRDSYARRAIATYADGGRLLARQNLDVIRQTYELGRATIFDVLNEQRRFLDLERAYTAALREAYEARVALRRAMGDVR